MAVEYIFDTKFFSAEVDPVGSAGSANNQYRIVIGDSTGQVNPNTFYNRGMSDELDMMDPGPTLEWRGGQDNFMNAFMGSTLSMTFRLDDKQLECWEEMLEEKEGAIFALFFTSHAAGARPYWYGHLVIEDSAITIQNEHHFLDVKFTDGLAYLRGVEWKDDNPPYDGYTGFKRLIFWMKEVNYKIPAFVAYRDYVQNELGQSAIPMLSEIAMPSPSMQHNGGTQEFHHSDSLLYYMQCRADTFNKPKKQVDRTRELEAPPKYFDTASVLEDIAHTFGATVILFDGMLNLVNRLDLATMQGEGVHRMYHKYTPTTDSWTSFNDTSAFHDADFDDKFKVEFGAVKRRTVPVFQVELTHEEGGSDWLYADGFYLNSNIGHINHNELLQLLQNQQQSLGIQPSILFYSGGNGRRDKWYRFHDGSAPDPSESILLPYYQYPASATSYMGFPERTMTDLEFQSGEVVKLQLGANARFWTANGLNLSPSSAFKKFAIGVSLICRVRLEFKDTNGNYWRLRRVVTTHVMSNGSPDAINIDNILTHFDSQAPLGFVTVDKPYFRKLYSGIEWIKSGEANYDDAWYEILIPHEATNNTGDGWGATTVPLTIQYGDQTNYAPVGCKIQGEDNGTGVILEEGGDEHLFHYMYEDITIPLPTESNNAIVDFEEFRFEMGFQMYEPDHGPRPNTNQTNTGTWDDSNPVWRSANADGTGGYDSYAGNTHRWKTRPQWIQVTGCRVTVGDGSEAYDLTTRVDGGDGYEIVNIGSSRLGSRANFVNNHVAGTLWAKNKLSDADGDFDFAGGGLSEKLQWRGHRAGDSEAPNVPEDYYDSLHAYVCNAYMDIFGGHRKIYDMNLIPTGNGRSLIDPITVGKTSFARLETLISTEFDHIMPLSLKWTANSGVQGSFLVVGYDRVLDPGLNWNDWISPIGFEGTTNNTGNGSGGGLVGDVVKTPIHGLDDWGVVSFLATKGDCINLHGGTPVGSVKPAWETIRYFHDRAGRYDNFDFEEIHDAVEKVTFRPPPPGDSVVIVDSNGEVSYVADGTSGQVLQTDGNGNYSFVTPTASSGKIILATIATKVEAVTGRSLYYGDSRGSWFDSPWTARIGNTATTIAGDQFRNAAMTVLTTTNFVELNGIVMPQTQRDDLEITVFTSRATSTGASLTLTRLMTQTIRISAANVPVPFSMVNRNAARIGKGMLIWVMIGRVSSSNVTNADTLFTFTITTE